ncbi:hypothetical protein [Marinicella rhabdoformis]|uniref:[protein-PII] uridylyltransferase family protein n=1 Tax=Marinicella rhabdoformis TaxID=2580566 RepID=UPI0012AEC66E|nr:hypothetical protein [Marinicella rhabdoformis]
MGSKWLETFPFVVQQQAAVEPLMELYPSLNAYDVDADWQTFSEQHIHHDVFKNLREFRQSRLALIAQLDCYLSTAEHGLAMLKTSQLADCLVQHALTSAEQYMVERYGRVFDESNEPVTFAVLALGKLGTNELNYSSDIDLVFVCSGDGQSDGKRSLEATRYFEKLGRRLIKLLDQFTADGRVYRVDMRLRPFGSAAPLVCTDAALQHYIITEGREWERFAWMRARFVAGHAKLSASVLASVNPFIYRKHLDYSVFDSLAKIKRDMALSAKDHQHDLKLGAGGIREIEFIVQSLQVTFGGRLPELQGVSIEPQFDLLMQYKKIQKDNAQGLKSAWLFMRRLENLCQIINDEQTHVTPRDSGQLLAMANLMGLASWKSCEQQWQVHQKLVQKLFNALFVADEPQQHLPDEVVRWIKRSMEVHFTQKMTQDRADHMQKLLERAAQLDEIDVLEDRLIPILKAIMRRPSYVLMLLQEKSLLPSLLKLIKQNEYFVKTWVQHPALLELLFEPELLPKSVDRSCFEQAWQKIIVSKSDEEEWMEAVRFFKHKQQFRLIQTALTLGFSGQYLRDGFSVLADFFIALVVEKGWQETSDRLGLCGLQAEQMMVLAYGSLGMRHMGLHSDVDLVFVVDADELNADQLMFLQRWAKRISHHLMVKMYHGVLYDLDLQLRPNGNAGALVTSRKEFESYQCSEAWVWEHAALIKARLLGQNETQQLWFKKLKFKVLCDPKRSPDAVRQAMREMAEKLTQFGSVNHHDDLQFLEQILLSLPEHPDLLEAVNYRELLSKGVECSVINQSLADSLLNQKSPI